MDLEKLIASLLREHTELKAKDIAVKISGNLQKRIDKQEVNKVLYASKGRLFDCGIDYKWRLLTDRKQEHTKVTSGFVTSGTILEILPRKEGEKFGRKWTKQDLVVECIDTKKPASFTIWNGKFDSVEFKQLDKVSIEFDVVAKKTVGAWRNYLVVKKITRL